MPETHLCRDNSDQEIIKIDDTNWIELVEIERDGRTIGYHGYLCQGTEENHTEVYISAFNIHIIIDGLKKLQQQFVELTGKLKISKID